MKILSFLTMLFLTCQCYSQIDSTRLLEAFDEMYDQETMLLGEGYFMKKGAINKLGIFGKNIKHEMVEYGSQEALEEFSKFKRKRIQGGFLLLGGYMMGISAMVYAP
ncbi:MAG: hypothetical protein MRY83_07820, partial [Flavobacteriales bacterium]|nr:hypothetical protein [Flavobacteriales bacterium]